MGPVGRPKYRAAECKKAKDMRAFCQNSPRWLSAPCLIVTGMEVDMIAELGDYATRGLVPISWKDMSIEAEMENGKWNLVSRGLQTDLDILSRIILAYIGWKSMSSRS